MMPDSPGMSFLHPELEATQTPVAPAEPGAPEAPPGDQPQPEQATTPETPSEADGPTLIFGKYRSLEEAQKGYFEQVNSFMQEKAKREVLEQVLAQPRAYPAPPAAPPPDPDLEELNDLGIPVQTLERFVRHVAARTAKDEYQSQVEPMFRARDAAQEAHDVLAQRLPDFAKREQAVADYIKAQPELDARYRKLFQIEPLAAMEWAYFQHEQSIPPGPRPPGQRTPANQPGPAALPGGIQSSRSVPQNPTGELELTRQFAKQSGELKPFLNLRLKGIHPELG